jgi:thiol-disulfide isomerase/thioredoxin
MALAAAVAASGWLADNTLQAAAPTAEQALQLAPIQQDIDYDKPDKAAVAKCKVLAEPNGDAGWTVLSESGETLRRFLDSNGDNKVDQWCYFKHGVEIYRDLDANYNGLADQYRWLGTAGTRWGLDKDEDGRIDGWKQISAEEATAELVYALRDKNAARFQALLMSNSELKSLGLGDEKTQDMAEKIKKASEGFADFIKKQKVVTAKSEWINFGGSQPGVLPAGTEGSTKDLIVYDNVAAVIDTDGKTSQLPIGALVKVGDVWRLIDLPAVSDDLASAGPPGYFFQAPLPKTVETSLPVEQGLSQEMQKLITDLEKVDKDLIAAKTPVAQGRLNAARADIMEQLAAKAANAEERANWLRQLADTVSAAVQGGGYADGIARLETLLAKLEKEKAPSGDIAYVKFRYMTAGYTQSLQSEKADFVKIQEQWIKDLESFVADYPSDDDTAEAMLQLAIAEEFAGKEEDATKWFDTIVKKFPKHELATKAAGASYRLNCVGKSISLKGKATDGRSYDLAAQKGKVVLIQYWSTWCEPCKADMDELKKLQAKYAKQGFTLVGVSLDSDEQAMLDFLKTKRLTWPQLYEPGGLDSPLANELGVLTLPTMILVDAKGKVISRNISIGELDAELGKQLR